MSIPVMKIAVELNVSRQIVSMLLKAAKGLPDGTVPKQKNWFWQKAKNVSQYRSYIKTRSNYQSINHTCKFEKEAPKAVGGGINPNTPKSAEK